MSRKAAEIVEYPAIATVSFNPGVTFSMNGAPCHYIDTRSKNFSHYKDVKMVDIGGQTFITFTIGKKCFHIPYLKVQYIQFLMFNPDYTIPTVTVNGATSTL